MTSDIRYRANEGIRGVNQIRLIDIEGKMVGVVPFWDAINKARAEGLDLVEINRGASPPVCKILDFGKFKYDQEKAAKEAKKKQVIQELKEVSLRPATDTHDVLVKAKHVKEWLEEGSRIKIVVKMKGREKAHPEQAVKIVQELLNNSGPHKVLGQIQNLDGRQIVAMIERQ